MGRFNFTSRLEELHRSDLESLLYFNPEQGRVIGAIERTLADWGIPEIGTEGEWLKITLGSGPQIQALYAIDVTAETASLAGVVIFTRSSEETLDLLHMAVNDGYAASGPHGEERLAVQMLCRVRELARRLRGVRQVILHYRGGLAIPVQLNRDGFATRAEENLSPETS
jgi:hypothetical protein